MRNDVMEIKLAHEAWQNAQAYFESVSEPELIDYAIFQLEATKRRYMYMLSRQKNLESQMSQTVNGEIAQ